MISNATLPVAPPQPRQKTTPENEIRRWAFFKADYTASGQEHHRQMKKLLKIRLEEMQPGDALLVNGRQWARIYVELVPADPAPVFEMFCLGNKYTVATRVLNRDSKLVSAYEDAIHILHSWIGERWPRQVRDFPGKARSNHRIRQYVKETIQLL